jgi:hypothetical protein
VTAPEGDPLTTFAPAIDVPLDNIPTGNLWVSLSRIERGTGAVRTIACLHEGANGMVEMWGDDDGAVVPFVEIDGIGQTLDNLTWTREYDWLPRAVARCAGGELEALYCAPTGERGAAFRLTYRRTDQGSTPVRCTVGWQVRWDSTALTQLRSKPIQVTVESERDTWTHSHVLAGTAGLPLLAVGIQPGGDAELLASEARDPACVVTAVRELTEGEEIVADLLLAVAPERDGAATGALHLRRRGFDDLWATTTAWLGERRLPVADLDPRPGLAERVSVNAFFNYFFSQGDCLDTGRSVIVTSRSSDYYVSAAFWSRDAYLWTFPALLLVDPGRAREVLVASIEAAGGRIADHALYINGTSLYPGFELDQAAAPILAVHLYVVSTGDDRVLEEPAVRRLCDGFVSSIAPWRDDELGLYATFLLPTDDPTSYPYTTTNNALVRAAFESLARLEDRREVHGEETSTVERYRELADDLGRAIAEHLVLAGPSDVRWAWACDRERRLEGRDEPPLSLSTLPFWGLFQPDDPRQVGTRHWLAADNPFQYDGAFPGAGSPHFPFPSGFDLANRLLMSNDGADPLQQLVETSMDNGLGCESWDPLTGRVATGAAMASMAGLLTWAAWSRLTGRVRWDQPLRREPPGWSTRANGA